MLIKGRDFVNLVFFVYFCTQILKTMDYELYKSRSYRSIISTGFGYYFTYFRQFLKASWRWTILFSLLFAAWAMLIAVQLPAITSSIMHEELVEKVGIQTDSAQQYLMTAGGIVVLALLCLVAGVWIAVKVLKRMNLLQGEGKTDLPKGWMTIARQLIKPRNWGILFLTLLLGGMILGILASICCLPALILALTHFLSQEGALNGDPLGMPGYMTVLSAITFFLTGAVLVYLCMPMLTWLYYVYGSVISFEREKSKITNLNPQE